MRWGICVLAIASASCLRTTAFECSTDSSCGGQGVCESSHYCSFPDPDCAGGRRYSSSAGTLADQCVGGSADAGVDPMGDARTDTPPAGCPAGYNMLPNLTTTHLYKLVTVADDWTKQQMACRLTTMSANLAIPDDATELMAMDALAGGTAYWVGITDSATEGVWLTVLGMAQTFLPWQPPAPDNNAPGQGENCVEALVATHTINDLRCNMSLPAICECVPP